MTANVRKMLRYEFNIRVPVAIILSVFIAVPIVDLWLWPRHPWWLFWVIGAAIGVGYRFVRDRWLQP